MKPDIYQRDRSTIRMEPFVAVRGRLQKDGETINVIAHEVTGLRLAGGQRPPSPRTGPTRAGAIPEEEMEGVPNANPLIREDELFPALPNTQEWWPDRGKLERKEDGSGGEKSRPGPNRGKPAPPGERGERRRQGAQEDAATERRKRGRQGRQESPLTPSPELPGVREWWGKPELARKSPFAYLTALRQAPPGTKSWG